MRSGENFYTEMNYEKILWLINLRFLLIFIITLLYLVFHFYKLQIGIFSLYNNLMVWNLISLLINLFFLIDIKYLKNSKHIMMDESNFAYIGMIHIDFDIIYIVITILMTGGLESPLILLFIYNIITVSFIISGNSIYFYTSIMLILLFLTGFRFSVIQEFPFITFSFISDLSKLMFTLVIYAFITYISRYISKRLSLKQEELNALYERTYRLSITDRLTGLYDQTYFRVASSDALEIAGIGNNMICVVMFDIDNFKDFNDTNGHLYGSRALLEIADIMRNSFRKTDILGKYGGDEFIILMRDIEPEYVPYILERFKKRINIHDFNPETKTISHLTVSLGASIFPDDGMTIEALIDKADKALYYAKKMGKNQLFIFNDIKK